MNCSEGFSSSGPCGVSLIGSGGQPWAVVGTTSGSVPALQGTSVKLIPKGAQHAALSLNYQTQLDIRAFTISFTFVPNGSNVALVIQNSTNNPYGFNGPKFSSGAGCEAGFFQAYGQPAPDYVFALELDSYSALKVSDPWTFTHSSAQIYKSGESPCNPNDSGNNYPRKDKLSTDPVPLCSPANAQGSTTGHTYLATVTYDGSDFSLDLTDIGAGADGPHFIHTWPDVNIPEIVGNNMAWVGFTGATGGASKADLLISSFSYDTGTPAPEPPEPEPGPEPEPEPEPGVPQPASLSGQITIGGKTITYELTGTATQTTAAPTGRRAAVKKSS